MPGSGCQATCLWRQGLGAPDQMSRKLCTHVPRCAACVHLTSVLLYTLEAAFSGLYRQGICQVCTVCRLCHLRHVQFFAYSDFGTPWNSGTEPGNPFRINDLGVYTQGASVHSSHFETYTPSRMCQATVLSRARPFCPEKRQIFLLSPAAPGQGEYVKYLA